MIMLQDFQGDFHTTALRWKKVPFLILYPSVFFAHMNSVFLIKAE